MEAADFIRLDRQHRLDAVRAAGEYLGSRAHGGHRVHLYRMDGFFCEVWMRLGWDQVEWIEVARNTDVLSEYVHLDLKGL
ncbi:MAG TPA: hypothetical protein PKY96_10895 [Flavobacteriales bacterium]|nr:hypothetical protein [Flavobacteriales bacterium]